MSKSNLIGAAFALSILLLLLLVYMIQHTELTCDTIPAPNDKTLVVCAAKVP